MQHEFGMIICEIIKIYVIPTFSYIYCHDARAIRPDLLQVDFIIFEHRGHYISATRNELIPSRTVYLYI